MNKIDPAHLNNIVGKAINEASCYAMMNKFSLREVEVDGQQMMLTAEFRPDRVNVAITNGLITKICSIG